EWAGNSAEVGGTAVDVQVAAVDADGARERDAGAVDDGGATVDGITTGHRGRRAVERHAARATDAGIAREGLRPAHSQRTARADHIAAAAGRTAAEDQRHAYLDLYQAVIGEGHLDVDIVLRRGGSHQQGGSGLVDDAADALGRGPELHQQRGPAGVGQAGPVAERKEAIVGHDGRAVVDQRCVQVRRTVPQQRCGIYCDRATAAERAADEAETKIGWRSR